MESILGHDFSRIRVHRNQQAAAAAQTLSARAFTVGHDIVFNDGQYSPNTGRGRQLLAHELVHTVQQQSAPRDQYAEDWQFLRTTDGPRIQRTPDDKEEADEIHATDLFPFPEGSQFLVTRTLKDFYLNVIRSVLASQSPESVDTLNQVVQVLDQGRVVFTVATAEPDVFEATLSAPITLPGTEDTPEVNVRSLTLTISKRSGTTFQLQLAADLGDNGGPVRPDPIEFTASREENESIKVEVPTQADVPPLFLQTSDVESLQIEVEAPVIGRIEALSADRLPPAEMAPANVDRAVQEITERARGQRRERRQEAGIALGEQRAGSARNLAIAGSWRISFATTPLIGLFSRPEIAEAVGGVVRIPLQAELQFASQPSLVARASTGVEIDLTRINVPVNVRLLGGVAGGVLQAGEGSEGQEGAFGFTVGGELGFARNQWRVNLRADQLYNLLGPNVQTYLVGGGFAF